MNTAWEIDRRTKSSSKSKDTSSPLDLVKVGLQGLDSTINILDDLLNSVSIGTKSSKGGCDCNCECTDSMMECYSCGPLKSNTDLVLQARFGERRILSLLIENNKETPQQVSINTSLIMDVCGNRIDGARENFAFNPSSFVIPACHCQRVKLAINIGTPFKAGTVYYIELQITGQCAEEKITLALYVQPDNYIDHFTLIDPCRPKKGRYIEFNNCDCGCCGEGNVFYICDDTTTSTIPGTANRTS